MRCPRLGSGGPHRCRGIIRRLRPGMARSADRPGGAHPRALRVATVTPHPPYVRGHRAVLDRHTGCPPVVHGHRPHPSDYCGEGLPAHVVDHAIRREGWPHRQESLSGPWCRRGAGPGTPGRHDVRGRGPGSVDAGRAPDRRGAGGLVPATQRRSARAASQGRRPRTRGRHDRGNADDSHVRSDDREGAEDARGSSHGRRSTECHRPVGRASRRPRRARSRMRSSSPAPTARSAWRGLPLGLDSAEKISGSTTSAIRVSRGRRPPVPRSRS